MEAEFCQSCVVWLCNGDASHMSDDQYGRVLNWRNHAIINYDSERREDTGNCECCQYNGFGTFYSGKVVA